MNAQQPRKRCLRLACAAAMTVAAGAWYPAGVAQPLYPTAVPGSAAAASAPVPAASSLAPPVSGVPPLAAPAPGVPPAAPFGRGPLPAPETPPQLPPVAAPRPPLPMSPPAQPVQGLPADAPKLVISGGVYSANPRQRMLIVNGQVVREGADLGSGMVIQQIIPDGVVLAYRGAHYKLMY
jgi:general secretion pathway protein B